MTDKTAFFSRMATVFTREMVSTIILMLSVLDVIICFIPVMRLPTAGTSSSGVAAGVTTNSTVVATRDDDYLVLFHETEPYFTGAAWMCTAVVLPTMIDALLDLLPDPVVLFFFRDARYTVAKKEAKAGLALRMTSIERLLFCTGMLVLTAASYPVLLGSAEGPTNIWYGFTNANTSLAILPILSFLTRTSDSITPLRGMAITALLFLGPLLITVGQCLPDHTSETAMNLILASNIVMTIPPGLFLLCIAATVFQQWRAGAPESEDAATQSERRFRATVMGAHMTTCLCCMLIETVWFWLNGLTHLSSATLSDFMYASVGAAVVVFVVEVRVRKNEYMQSLYRLSTSKRNYVRYVSHELRTPMNAAFLGLKLVNDQLKDTTSPRERDIYETLHDVQLACSTAVEILNDLLSFEKLDGGILDVHKQDVPVLRFLTETLRQFSGQARERGVVLKSDFYSATSAVAGSAVDKAVRNILHGEEVASLLREHDTCAIDRFKMEQVVRNLVSNALKFSPSGSMVTVHAYFVPSEENQEWDGRQGARPPPVLRKTLSSFMQTSSKQWGSSLFSTSCVQPSGRRKGFRVVADNADGKGGSDGGRSRHKTKSGPPPPQPPVDPALSLNVSDGLAGGGGGGVAVGAMSARSGVSDGDSGGEEIVNGRLVITVEDSGPGISLENQQRLFREVVQFDPHKLQAGGGSGFGLYLSDGIVTLHGGKITCFSEGEGHGCAFSLQLPMKRCPRPRGGVSGCSIRSVRSQGDARRLGLGASAAPSDDGDGSKVPSALPTARSGGGGGGVDTTTVAAAMALAEPGSRGSAAPPGGRLVPIDSPKRAAGGAGGGGTPSQGPLPPIGAATTPAAEAAAAAAAAAAVPVQRLLSAATLASSSTSLMVAAAETREHLLVVDDSGLSRKMLARILEAEGYTCVQAVDGRDALEKVRANMAEAAAGTARRFDVVLSDYQMPQMDGPTSVREMRKIGFTGKIFGVTGNGLKDQIEFFMNAGCNHVLVKPFSLDDFAALMRGSSDEIILP